MNLMIKKLNFTEAVWGFPEVVDIKLHQIPFKQNVLQHKLFIIKQKGKHSPCLSVRIFLS
ncbi:hypothetical protein FH5T_02665 [Draconibacterium orientale]|uniref:Uncharacterized protein n=1 Tax=Draconibacterium orientale TaxID=1168034 RepID=A0ABN4D1H0_9BACT|nr:hypothetical protein FH5T_02665 [Draconibacterium orientale]